MCGIAGIYRAEGDLPPDSREILERMRTAQSHRGPDDTGDYLSEHCGLSFCRLSVIDPEGGHQPMYSPTGRSVIVFNGEIYNYRELRKELERKGVAFRTHSDTEVLLAGYEEWGEGILSRVRGMFAFAAYDTQSRQLFAARDHTGIKPLYYSSQPDGFLFSSEAKAILRFPGVSARVRTALLPRYLSFLWVPAPDTLFEGIFMLEPGHCLLVNREGMTKRRYWNPELTRQDHGPAESAWIDLVDRELGRAVREQMVSDVPLGAFLSGGVDSSSIVEYMTRVSAGPICTYTTGFTDEDLSRDVIRSDLPYARQVSARLDVAYHEIILRPDVTELLPRLVWHMDEPVADPAALTTYLICRAAAQDATVMLSGVGGDELFGGYPRYRAAQLAETYRRIPEPARRYMIEPVLRWFPAGEHAFFRNARKFVKHARLPFPERYFGYLTYYSEPELRRLLRMDFDRESICAGHRRLFGGVRSDDPLQSMMNLDLKTFLPNLNLLYTDKMSMAASMEVRVPFLDHLLIERVAAIPGGYKVSKGRQKYILKKTVEGKLPPEVVWRRKAGFGAPIGAWLRGQARELMLDLLSEESVKKRGYFNHACVSTIIDEHLSGREYHANQLWQLMTLELWHQQFVDA